MSTAITNWRPVPSRRAMTRANRKRSTRRPGRSGGRGGFIAGLRKATHTDRLRHRLGAATGRAILTRINRRRSRQGKEPLPIVGSWMKPATVRRRMAGQKPGTSKPGARKRKGPSPATAKGPNVVARNGPAARTQPSRPAGSRTPRKPLAVDLPRTAGQKPEWRPQQKPAPDAALQRAEPVPAGVSPSGATWWDWNWPGHLRRGGSSEANPTRMPWPQPDRSTDPVVERIVDDLADRAGIDRYGTPIAGHPRWAEGMPTAPQPTPSRGAPVSVNLTEAPATDAEHLSNIGDLATETQRLSEELAEYISQCADMGMDDSALSSLRNAAEQLGEAASAIAAAPGEFESVYSGVRETAAAGTQIIGENGPSTWWTGEGA